jgi:hypothetical protein
VDRTRQTQADNIVGKMTMAALDREMLAKEKIPRGPILIRARNPLPSGGASADDLAQRIATGTAIAQRSTLLLGFKIDVDVPLVPSGGAPVFKIRLEPRSTGELEIVNGRNGIIRCDNQSPQRGVQRRICQIFDPAKFDPVERLVPEPQGPNVQLEFGGIIRLAKDRHIINVDVFRPGNAFIDASNGTSSNLLTVEVRAPKLGRVPGEQTAPLEDANPDSDFFSKEGTDETVPGGFKGGRPVSSKVIGTGRKINLGGEGETPGFENYQFNLDFCGYHNKFTGDKFIFRPWTEDSDPAVRVKDGEASCICIRGTPVHLQDELGIKVIRRIAAKGCRLFFSGVIESLNSLKAAFPSRIREESIRRARQAGSEDDGKIVIDLP